MHVSTYKTWDEMGRWYWGLVQDQFVPDDEVRRRAEALTKGLKDDRAKVRAVYDYVVQKTRYVALEFGIHGYKPYRCAQIFARGFGDCKDKATLIVTMLNALGIKATPVVVRTGNKGDIESDAGEPRAVRSHDRVRAVARPLPRRHGRVHGLARAAAMDRGALALQVNEGNAEARAPAGPARERERERRTRSTRRSPPTARAQLDWRADVSGVEASEWRVRFHADATRKQRVQQMLLAAILPGSEVTRGRREQPRGRRADGDDAGPRTGAAVRAAAKATSLTVPLGRGEHMVRDYAPLAARHARRPARTRSGRRQDDWTVHLPPGAKVQSVADAVEGDEPVRVVRRRRRRPPAGAFT